MVHLYVFVQHDTFSTSICYLIVSILLKQTRNKLTIRISYTDIHSGTVLYTICVSKQ